MADVPTTSTVEDTQEIEELYRDDTMEEIAAELAPLGTVERDASQCEWYNIAMADLREYEALQARKAEEDADEYLEEFDSEDEVEESPEPEDFFRTSSRDSTGRGCSDDDWVVEEILSKKRKKWVNFYQVKWKGWADPTWETEEDMEDYGWGDWLAKFDVEEINRKRLGTNRDNTAMYIAKIKSSSKAHRALISRAEKVDRYALYNYHSEVCRVLGKTQEIPPPPRISRSEPGMFDPDEFWPDYITRIRNAFKLTNCTAVRIQNIVEPRLQDKFTQLFNDPASGVPVMTFHGTAADCIPGIIKNGLRVPGKGGVVVRNGSSYGVGIYMSTAAGTPCSYVRGSILVVVVSATLVGSRFLSTTQNVNTDWIVVTNEDQVLPCYIVEIQYNHTFSNPYSHELPYKTDFYHATKPWPIPPLNLGNKVFVDVPVPTHVVSPYQFYLPEDPKSNKPDLMQVTPAHYRRGTKGDGSTRERTKRIHVRGVTQRERKGLKNSERDAIKPRKH